MSVMNGVDSGIQTFILLLSKKPTSIYVPGKLDGHCLCVSRSQWPSTTPLSAKQILESAYGGHKIYLFNVLFYAKDCWLEELQGEKVCGEIIDSSAEYRQPLSIDAQSHQSFQTFSHSQQKTLAHNKTCIYSCFMINL